MDFLSSLYGNIWKKKVVDRNIQPHVNSGSVMLLHMMKKNPRNNSLMSVNRFYMPLKGKKKIHNTCCVQWQSNTIHYLSQKTQNIMRNEMSYYKGSSLTKTFIFLIRVTQRLSVDFIRMVTVRSPERTSGSEAEWRINTSCTHSASSADSPEHLQDNAHMSALIYTVQHSSSAYLVHCKSLENK